jgi:23S rRNA (adenine2503-C2)-methyltransferase
VDAPGLVPITELSDRDLEARVVGAGGQPFQARQIAHWVYRHGVRDWAGCKNLPGPLLARLEATSAIGSTVVGRREAAADGTVKLLVRLADGESVEAVTIPEGERETLCMSTQVGCPVACVFCASGLAGVRRNLTAGEMVEQVLHAGRQLPPGRKLTNIVVMGMGEPMLNLDNLLPALDRIRDPAGIAMGARRITVSTSGYPDRIRRFAAVPHSYGLAVSLHAADDDLRRRLVPTARASVGEMLDAARDYFAKRHREVTFEVVLLADVNDRDRDAEALVAALRDFPSTVNLIPWNPVDEIGGLARPADARVTRFASLLRAGGLRVTVRRQRGADRSAACGQLRLRATSSQGA